MNVLEHDEFLDGVVDTGFIAANPYLMAPLNEQDRAQKILKYIAEVRNRFSCLRSCLALLCSSSSLALRFCLQLTLDFNCMYLCRNKKVVVNSTPKSLGAVGPPPATVDPYIPDITKGGRPRSKSLKQVLDQHGPEAFAKAVRKNDGLLITDTTWRDAHQSLLATRMRTKDMLNIADATKIALANCYSIENWGGATFDVSMRFLRECPWDRLADLREKVPDIPFQMLLRGANAVGYTSYPDNVNYDFCKMAKDTGMDVFRVFDSLNYIENMRLGIDCAGEAGGVVEAAVSYTGDVADSTRGLYDLDYYLEFVRQLNDLGIHVSTS